MRREAAYHSKFLAFIRAEFSESTAAFEIKQTQTDSISFSSVKIHQRHALKAAKNHHLIFKPSDQAQGFKPCDYLNLSGAEAFIVIFYKDKGFVLIDIDKFEEEESVSERKSLTWERACAIAEIVRK